MKTSVIVPVFYEEQDLAQTLSRLAALRDRIDLEILCVVDSPDASREEEVRSVNDAVTAPVGAIAVYRIGSRGFGSALRHGFAEASGDVLIPFMGDASDNPEDIPRLVAQIEQGYDVVGGSRYIAGGGIVGNTLKQRVSRFYSILVRLVGGLPIHDVSNAFKAYRRSVVESVDSVADSFDISVELTVKAFRQGFRLGEVPTIWTNRKVGQSQFRVASELRNYGRWLIVSADSRRWVAGSVALLAGGAAWIRRKKR